MEKMGFDGSGKFFRSLYQLSKAGVPLTKALDIMYANGKRESVYKRVQEGIQAGKSLSDSLQDSRAFTTMAMTMVKMGEESGKLEEAFEKLFLYYEKAEKHRKEVYASLVYPCILLLSLLFLLGFIVYYFIPSIRNVYNFEYSRLNGVSRGIFTVSQVLNTYKWEVPLMVGSTGILIFLFFSQWVYQTGEGVLFYKMPIIGKIKKLHSLSTILWGYYSMMSSGLDIIVSSEIIRGQAKNTYEKKKLSIFLENVKKGNSITRSLEQTKIQEENIRYFLSLGEESGNLVGNIQILSMFYEEAFQKELKRITHLVQPALIVFITCIVAGVMVFVILPMMTIHQ